MATPEHTLDYGDEIDDTPDWVNEGDEDVSVGDLSHVPDDDTIPTARNVIFEIRKATLDTQEYKTEGGPKVWAKKNLHLELKIGPEGAGEPGEEGKPRYMGKVFFVNLLLALNREDFPEAFKYDKYKPDGRAWRPTKQFYKAMGGDVSNIQITRAFREELVGKFVKGDIIKRAKRAQVEGQWVDQGSENVIENFRKAE